MSYGSWNAFIAAAFRSGRPQRMNFARFGAGINRPGIRNHLYAERVSFERFLEDWHHWTTDTDTHTLAIEIRTTRLLIGFMLLQCDTDTVSC